MDAHPNFGNTKRIYFFPIWGVFQTTTIPAHVLERRIVDILAASDLVRVKPAYAFAEQGLAWDGKSPVTVLNRCLRLSLEHINLSSGLELVWYLYLEAEPIQNHDVRAMLHSLADELLDRFFHQFTPDRHLDNYVLALQALHESRIDFQERAGVTYGRMEANARWPILPKELAGIVTWERVENMLLASFRVRTID